jgi:hypothetical protein
MFMFIIMDQNMDQNGPEYGPELADKHQEVGGGSA